MRIVVLDAAAGDVGRLAEAVHQVFPEAEVGRLKPEEAGRTPRGGPGGADGDAWLGVDQAIQAVALFPLENPNPVLRVGRDGRILFANPASASLLQDLQVAAEGRVTERWQQTIAAILEQGVPRRYQITVAEQVFELDVVPIPAAGYVNVYGRTVTAEAHAVAALQQAKEDLELRVRERTAELEAIFASLPDAVYVGNAHGIYRCNQMGLDILGCRSIEDLWDAIPELAAKIQTRYADTGRRIPPDEEPFTRALHGERGVVEMIQRNLQTGQDVVVRSACSPIWQDGKVTGAVAVNTDITERKQAEAQIAEQAQLLQANKDQLQHLSHRLVELQEIERQYVARQLYDDEGQRLSALMLQLGLLERELVCTPAIEARIAQMKQLVNDLMADMHSLATDLRPASLDRLGLAAALRQYAHEFGRHYNLKVHLELTEIAQGHLAPEVDTVVYRIVQECLANVARHAQARHVSIILQAHGEQLTAIVEDDGVGFDVEAMWRAGRLGLLGMRERAQSLAGSLTVESAPGRGTAVYVVVPMTA